MLYYYMLYDGTILLLSISSNKDGVLWLFRHNSAFGENVRTYTRE